MEHFEEKTFWDIFNAPDPVVTLKSVSNIVSSTASSVTTTLTTKMSSSAAASDQDTAYSNDLLPPNALKMLPNAVQNLNQHIASPEDIREDLWLQFMTITALAFAAAVLLILIVVVAWGVSGSKSSKYSFDQNCPTSQRNESNPMICEDSV